MCPPCLNIFKLALIIALPNLPSHSKEKRIICLDPPTFGSNFFRPLPAPWQKNKIGLTPNPALTLSARK